MEDEPMNQIFHKSPTSHPQDKADGGKKNSIPDLQGLIKQVADDWNPHKENIPPRMVGEGFKKIPFKDSHLSAGGIVDPLLIFGSHFQDLWENGFLEVNQVFELLSL